MMLVTEVHALLDHESIAVHESNEYCDLSDAVVDHSAGDSNIKIRRPQNAFILYSNRNRADVARQFPGLSNHAVSRLLGTQWKSLSATERKDYVDMAAAGRRQHKIDHPHYDYNRPRKVVSRCPTLDALASPLPIPTSPSASYAPYVYPQTLPIPCTTNSYADDVSRPRPAVVTPGYWGPYGSQAIQQSIPMQPVPIPLQPIPFPQAGMASVLPLALQPPSLPQPYPFVVWTANGPVPLSYPLYMPFQYAGAPSNSQPSLAPTPAPAAASSRASSTISSHYASSPCSVFDQESLIQHTEVSTRMHDTYPPFPSTLGIGSDDLAEPDFIENKINHARSSSTSPYSLPAEVAPPLSYVSKKLTHFPHGADDVNPSMLHLFDFTKCLSPPAKILMSEYVPEEGGLVLVCSPLEQLLSFNDGHA